MTPSQHRFLDALLSRTRDLSLATLREDGYPQANTVNFAHDGTTLYFCTSRDSAKVRNLIGTPRVAASLHGDYEDLQGVRGVSLIGHAEVLPDDGNEAMHARNLLACKFSEPWELPSPQDPTTTVFVRVVPFELTLIDYGKSYGHHERVLLP
jgi:nitroimidazol reductase NimA-like FMN-containing flavoprotein (pyridoxamine 5'-phosphate oxidase superfamily)